QNPYYDVDSQFTVANVIYANGIAYRTDRIDGSTFTSGNGYDAMWDAAHKGKLAVLDSYRDTISLAMFQAGLNDVNTSDADVLAAAKENLIRLRDATNPKVDIISYQELPAGNRDIAYTWSGDVLTALGYLPDGTSPETLGFWYPDQTITANDFYCIPKESKAPVLAHKFIDYILDTDVALKNQSYVGYQPALSTITVDNLLANGTIPESLKDSLVTPEKYASGQRLVSLNPDADALWLDVWASFTAG
ncbi:MAG: extracellular solute-binding protein, partial [Actinomycetota bacterium]